MGLTGIILIIIQAVSKVAGFIRELVLSNYYGASSVADAFLTASTLPSLIYTIIGASITVSYIPIYNRLKKSRGLEKAEKFTSNLINIIVIVTIFISIIIFIFTKPVIRVFALGFDEETLRLAITLTRISILSIVFLGLTGIFTPYLNIKKEYIIPSMIGIPLNIGMISGIILSRYGSVMFLGIGILIGYLLQTAIHIPCLRKVRYKHEMFLNVNNESVKQMVALSIPVIVGTSVSQVNFLIDRTIASTLQVGAISALNYAVRLNTFAQGLIIFPIITLLYPTISELVVNKKYKELNKITQKTFSVVTLLIVPIIIGGFILSKEITSALFVRGAFDENALYMTEGAVKYYIIGTAGLAFRDIYSRIFYSFNDTITPAKNTVISVVINVILNLVLSRIMGIKGLALATSISTIITAGLLKKDLKKYLPKTNSSKALFINQAKILIAGLIMGGGILLYQYFKIPEMNTLQLIIQIGLGAIIFLLMILILRIDELEDGKKMLQKLKEIVFTKLKK